MYELEIAVTKVLGACTADPPVAPGDTFNVCDGNITIPEGGYICLYALQSMLPLITPKERSIAVRNTPDDVDGEVAESWSVVDDAFSTLFETAHR